MSRGVSDSPSHGGTLRLAPSGYFAQFSIGKKQRKGTLLRTCKTAEEAERRKLAIAKLVALLRESGDPAAIPDIIR